MRRLANKISDHLSGLKKASHGIESLGFHNRAGLLALIKMTNSLLDTLESFSETLGEIPFVSKKEVDF
jgi:hypothetical protein